METIKLHEEIEIPVVGKGRLTTEHSASSYGQLVFVTKDEVYGPNDMVRGYPVKVWAQSSSQYTGVADHPWGEEICNAIRDWS